MALAMGGCMAARRLLTDSRPCCVGAGSRTKQTHPGVWTWVSELGGLGRSSSASQHDVGPEVAPKIVCSVRKAWEPFLHCSGGQDSREGPMGRAPLWKQPGVW